MIAFRFAPALLLALLTQESLGSHVTKRKLRGREETTLHLTPHHLHGKDSPGGR